MELTSKAKEAIEIMNNLNRSLYISRFSSNRGISGTYIQLSDETIGELSDNELIECLHQGDIHNYYTLTEKAKSYEQGSQKRTFENS